MSQLTSVIRENTSVVNYKLDLASQSLNAKGANTSALVLLDAAAKIITDSLDLLKPDTKFQRSRRIFNTALSIIVDYKDLYFSNEVSTAVSVPPLGTSVTISLPPSGNVSVPVSVTIPPLTPNAVATSDLAAILQLVRYPYVTHTAVSNGNWNSPTTWNPAAVPKAGSRVLISANRNVRYNLNSVVSLKTLRIDGRLSVAPNQNTKMVLDTMVVTSTGKLVIRPSIAYTASIEFAGGNIDPTWDTRLMSRGLLVLGDVSIHGRFKTPFKALRDNVTQNTKKLTATSAASGWVAGDKLVVTPTRMNPLFVSFATSPGVAETVNVPGLANVYTIQTITNNVSITLTTSVAHDHRMPTNTSNSHPDRPKRSPYVANMTRNVVFRTRVSSPVHQRAHVLFHHGHIHLNNAKFKHMGRTDKSKTVVDVAAVLNNPNTPVSARLNIRGRYPLHGHHLGLHSHAAQIYNNVVSGTPGWGIAHHDSNMDIDGNIVYEYYGAGIVAEVGNEKGKWNNNIVIKSVSRHRNLTKLFTGFDIFKEGQAYAFTARGLSVSGNVAAGFVNAAYSFLHRNKELLESKASVIQIPEWTKYNASIPADDIPIKNFNLNYGFVGKGGLEVIKGNPFQMHTSRNYFKNGVFFEVLRGIDIEYTYAYTIKNFDMVGKANPPSKQTKNECIRVINSGDVVFVSTRIRDFKHAYNLNLRTVGSPATQSWNANNNEFLVIEESVVSIASTKTVGTAAAVTTFKRNTQLPNTALSVIYSTTTTNYKVSTATPGNFLIKGTIIDSTGNYRYPIAFREIGRAEFYARDGTRVDNFFKNIAGNLGYFKISVHNYLVYRDLIQDRANETSAYRRVYVRLHNTPNAIWGVSSKLIASVATKANVSVPRWTGRSPLIN